MNDLPSLRIGGLTPLTTIDYPGELAAVVFCQGCAWRCTYCQNDHLWPPHGDAELPWSHVLSFLARRRGLLDAVVFSGGEPTLQSALAAAMQQVRGLGLKVGLHTAGPYPHRLARVLPHVDWVGLDVKALPADYDALTTRRGSGVAAWRSLELLLAHGIPHEVRVTVDAAQFPADRLDALLDRLRDAGTPEVVLQPCRDRQGHACVDAALLEGATRAHHHAFRGISVRG
ncbi:MAG: anaerobic ribonucleoside-triphosphate reductase activating protein [Gammaproteobacteria bacterium]|jgi:pyruvate formate lyase activating enzyme|nr:anaerobic ribonucleoside-triphosphate reductase activating protein [Gammaproteobacteria bacterium]